MLLLIQLIL